MDVSRRSFLSGSLLAGAGLVVGGLVGCSPASETPAEPPAGSASSDETVSHNPASTEQCDVVVVGSGTAGTCAALRAAELGKKVICLEKNSALGGTSVFAEGLCGIDSSFQAEQGIAIDKAAVLADTMKYHHYACLGPVVRSFIDSCGDTIDWLQDQGVVFSSVVALGDSYPVWHLPADETGAPTHMQAVLEILQANAKELGAEFRTSAPMTDLAVEDGAVIGIYTGSGNSETLIEAQAVILASGGYANNAELYEKFTGRPYESVHVWGMTGRDGDGITAAISTANADTHIPSAVMYHTGRIEGTDAFSDIPNFVLTMQPTMRVHAAAERYFNEAITSDFSATGNVLTTNAANYVIFDDAYIDHIEQQGPFCPMPNLGAFVGQPFACREGIEQCTGVVKADTIEELADKLGLNADTLAATIKRYNDFCSSGIDEDFGKPADQLLSIEKAPYYGAHITPTLFTTVGALRVNGDMRVIDMQGQPIEGLYAAGGDAAGLYGSNYDVDVCSGSQQGWAATSGKRAAEHLSA
ncbi:FAD-dependent oxidoreductase [Raoultibacter phocaeensis]|uniref:FAD-dependent oxidoreductase n=1 Tax=Raoultibacter phocaeensis TaxID=2479841 RepID=UPI0011182C7C|nr:FAD-dependent oxidoreductase [Raoultibacter phocaeensis]